MSPDSRLYIPFRRERTVSDVLNAAFVFLREEFRGLLKALLYIAGPPAVLAAFLTSASTVPTFEGILNPEAWEEPELGLGYWLGLGISLIALFLGVAVCYAYAMLYADAERETLTPGAVWERLRSDLRIYVSTALWIFLLFFGLALLNVIVCLGTVAFVVIGAYLAPILMMVYPARLDQRVGFWAALKRNRALVRGVWWPAFGLYVVTWVVTFLVGMGIGLVVILLGSLMATFVGEGLLGQVISGVLGLLTLATYVAYALPAVAFVIHYFNLVEQHEGVALESRVEAMAQEAGDAPGSGGLAL